MVAMRSGGLKLAAFVWLGVATATACKPDQPRDVSYATCPNVLPQTGDACPHADLTCNYFSSCERYDTATCQPGGLWLVELGCATQSGSGGGGGAGGKGPGSTSSAASSSSGSGGGH